MCPCRAGLGANGEVVVAPQPLDLLPACHPVWPPFLSLSVCMIQQFTVVWGGNCACVLGVPHFGPAVVVPLLSLSPSRSVPPPPYLQGCEFPLVPFLCCYFLMDGTFSSEVELSSPPPPPIPSPTVAHRRFPLCLVRPMCCPPPLPSSPTTTTLHEPSLAFTIGAGCHG